MVGRSQRAVRSPAKLRGGECVLGSVQTRQSRFLHSPRRGCAFGAHIDDARITRYAGGRSIASSLISGSGGKPQAQAGGKFGAGVLSGVRFFAEDCARSAQRRKNARSEEYLHQTRPEADRQGDAVRYANDTRNGKQLNKYFGNTLTSLPSFG